MFRFQEVSEFRVDNDFTGRTYVIRKGLMVYEY